MTPLPTYTPTSLVPLHVDYIAEVMKYQCNLLDTDAIGDLDPDGAVDRVDAFLRSKERIAAIMDEYNRIQSVGWPYNRFPDEADELNRLITTTSTEQDEDVISPPVLDDIRTRVLDANLPIPILAAYATAFGIAAQSYLEPFPLHPLIVLEAAIRLGVAPYDVPHLIVRKSPYRAEAS